MPPSPTPSDNTCEPDHDNSESCATTDLPGKQTSSEFPQNVETLAVDASQEQGKSVVVREVAPLEGAKLNEKKASKQITINDFFTKKP
jgi:hypothetical protein